MSFEWLWRRAANEAGPRDGHVAELEALRFSDPVPKEGAAARAPASLRNPAQARRALLEERLAAKLLGAHLDNRFQTSSPLVLNLGHYGEVHSAILMGVAAGALVAVGETNAAARLQAAERLRKAGAEDRQIAAFETAMARPAALAPLLDSAVSAGLSGQAYAVALVVQPRRTDLARLHLAYMAARLKLGPEIVGSLTRRFRT
ncbi:hypothetical protein [Aurantimonas sp. Leaf443]|uniref:hypothetical protein n=1 Tax=Aurantimonas sp. Leaf443 TaxID=1736378 RepID=UPI0006F8BDC7|nr:hypothetical protein [Aurantimonas sp. Leaf443]KQT83798.1 hypothetical protein ASG48_10345 [Aurantimonas sp. Leaf443]